MSDKTFVISVVVIVAFTVLSGIILANKVTSILQIKESDAWYIHTLTAGALTLGVVAGSAIMILDLILLKAQQ